ncbi:MAG: ABC transporter permease, partial [Chloroflexi bacterium]|nr:ABC transporter permease [Chloroflexota bacterium]
HLFKQWGEFTFSYLAAIVPIVTIVAYQVRRNVKGRVGETEWRLWFWGAVIATLAILFLGLGPMVDVPLYSLPAGGTQTLKAKAEPGTLLAAINATPNGIVDRLVHIILPTTCLSLLFMAGWSRFMRASMLEVLRQDFVRTARAKGLHERAVIAKHALRNALIPIITIVVFQIPGIFGGAVLTETIFSYPGIGRLYFSALGQSDWPIMMVFLFISAILVVVATLLGDILYTLVDPRIRFN